MRISVGLAPLYCSLEYKVEAITVSLFFLTLTHMKHTVPAHTIRYFFCTQRVEVRG